MTATVIGDHPPLARPMPDVPGAHLLPETAPGLVTAAALGHFG